MKSFQMKLSQLDELINLKNNNSSIVYGIANEIFQLIDSKLQTEISNKCIEKNDFKVQKDEINKGIVDIIEQIK